jgi:hypothetical protein
MGMELGRRRGSSFVLALGYNRTTENSVFLFQAEAKILDFPTAFTPPPGPSTLPSNAYRRLFLRE